jgi:hypothetical protein
MDILLHMWYSKKELIKLQGQKHTSLYYSKTQFLILYIIFWELKMRSISPHKVRRARNLLRTFLEPS